MRSHFIAAISLVFLCSCGGGGGNPQQTAPGGGQNQSPAGIYTGTIQFSGVPSVAVTAIVLDSGEFRYVDAGGSQASGSLQVSGSSFTGSGTLFSPTGMTFIDGTISTPLNLTNGSVSFSSSISSNFSYLSGHTTGSLNLAYSPMFTRIVGLAAIAGSYHSTTTSSGHPITSIAGADGSISGFDAFGTFTGSISQPNTAQNAFRVQVIYTQTGLPPQSFNGLGFLSDGASQNSVFNLQLSGSSHQFAAVMAK